MIVFPLWCSALMQCLSLRPCSDADLGKQCRIIFSMLGDDEAVRSVVHDILGAHPAKGTVIVECSTIHPSLTEELDSRAVEQGCHLLACPVFGRPDAVKAGNALFVCAGDPAAKQKVRRHSYPLISVTQLHRPRA